ncbi:MAG: heme exporter protein CcmD [Alphaproteobacteria bacterium]|nr:heme exporter protein CcmD [Alphaproteobacteria bacterium]
MSFFDMGGYAAYVWPAYILSALALTVLGIRSWRALRRVERLVALSENPEKQT